MRASSRGGGALAVGSVNNLVGHRASFCHDLDVAQLPDLLAEPSGFLSQSCHFGLSEIVDKYVVSGLLRLLIRSESDHFGISRHKRLINLVLLKHIAA